MHTGRCLGAGDDGAGSSGSENKSSGSGSENKSSSDAEQVAENAMREVRIVRRREREEYDEVCLYNSAVMAGSPAAPDSSSSEQRQAAISLYIRTQVEALYKDLTNDLRFNTGGLLPSMKHTLDVQESRCENAGEGLFLASSSIKRGDLVAFYPGRVFMAEEVRWGGGFGPLFDLCGVKDLSYLLGRKGGMVIDGAEPTDHGPCFRVQDDLNGLRPEGTAQELHEHVVNQLRDRSINQKRLAEPCPNPYALGHKANHPPTGTTANVVGWPFDFSDIDATDDDFARFIPNSHALVLDKDDCNIVSRHTIVLIAAEDIACGEELYLDYGFELSSQELPSWFSPATLRKGDATPIGQEEADEAMRQAEEQRRNLQQQLLEWRSAFETEHGRPPTREDMLRDEVAAELFASFQKLSQLDWPEEMKGQRV